MRILIARRAYTPLWGYKKHLGRPNKYEYSFYLKHIINVTINGLSWSKLGDILQACVASHVVAPRQETNTDLIRKKYNKWKSLGIFLQAYTIAPSGVYAVKRLLFLNNINTNIEDINKNPISKGQEEIMLTPSEILYQVLLFLKCTTSC